MEATTTNVLSVVALIIAVGGTVIGIINHKKVVSRCCGRKVDVSLDIGDTRHAESPKDIKPSVV